MESLVWVMRTLTKLKMDEIIEQYFKKKIEKISPDIDSKKSFTL